jgi:DNA-binding NarL/FixJ family response regulator
VKRNQENLVEYEGTAAPTTDAKCPLTLKQLHLLSVAVWYGTNTEALAGVLGTSKHTVNNHFSHIIQILKCTSRANAVLIALRNGWISMAGEPLLPAGRNRPEPPPEEIK